MRGKNEGHTERKEGHKNSERVGRNHMSFFLPLDGSKEQNNAAGGKMGKKSRMKERK